MIGQPYDYKRNGTTTLFAAFDVGSGAVMGLHCKRRRIEFLDFMNRVVAQHQGKEIHVILKNLSTHKPKRWTCGCDGTRMRISTTRRPMRRGLTKSKSGPPSWRASRSRRLVRHHELIDQFWV
jgi:hypothetical protein